MHYLTAVKKIILKNLSTGKFCTNVLKNCFYPQVRPLVGQEKVHNVPQCVHFIPDKPQLILGKDRGFTFDYVFPPKTTQVRKLSEC